MSISCFSDPATSAMVEDANGAVFMVAEMYPSVSEPGFILQLSHAESQWVALSQRLKVLRHTPAAMLVADSFANCSISAK